MTDGPQGRRRGPASRVLLTVIVVALFVPLVPSRAGASAPRRAGASPSSPPVTTGPAPSFDCALNLTTDAFAGVESTAAAIGWEGNQLGVVTCLGGSFLVLERGLANEGFGIYDGSPTTWRDADGYLPAQITTFHRFGATVTITEFADRLQFGSEAFVAVYCRASMSNPTNRRIEADPGASTGLVALNSASDAVPAHRTVAHDYVIAVDRFGGTAPWPTSSALENAGGFDAHFRHMQRFWDGQLAKIAEVQAPDRRFEDAYRAGFIATQIARSGNDLDTGVNGYQMEFSHDVVGILTNLFTQGSFGDAHALLLEARNAVGQGQYVDGLWLYALPWAVYLMKTGDVGFVRANFAQEGSGSATQPSIEDAAHLIAADRTGPGGTMEATDDIDTQGYWTVDDFESLLGLAAYAFVAGRLGEVSQAKWARQQYAGLLTATDAALERTIGRYGLSYLPCSLFQPDTANRCADPEDANWASPLAAWAWEGALLGAPVTGPGADLIDATYAWGFSRLHGLLPRDTFGGYPGDYYSSGYNATYGTAGLAGGPDFRSQGVQSFGFMIDESQSGPNAWWESSGPPSTLGPWIGEHPTSGQGSSPHAWGMAGADKVLLDSIAAQGSDGSLVVGRGVPDAWLLQGSVGVTAFPTQDGRRVDVRMVATRSSVSLAVSGASTGRILFELPGFVGDVATASSGSVDERTGTVALRVGVRQVTVALRHPLRAVG